MLVPTTQVLRRPCWMKPNQPHCPLPGFRSALTGDVFDDDNNIDPIPTTPFYIPTYAPTTRPAMQDLPLSSKSLVETDQGLGEDWLEQEFQHPRK